jgi:hypothetical protein
MSDPEARFDLAFVSTNRGRAIADRAGADFIRNLAALRIIRPVEESVARDWVEVYCEPGEAGHDPFVQGARPTEEAIFQEAVIRFGMQPTSLGYGLETDAVRFYLEFRGCLYQDVLGGFREHISRLLLLEPELMVRPARADAGHREVPADERPVGKAGSGSSNAGQVGVRIEEL